MNKLSYIGIASFIIATASPLTAQSTAARSNELSIIENGSFGITIIYTPEIKLPKTTINGTQFTHFDVHQSTFDARPGEPIIPCRQVLIAVPEGSRPTATIDAYEYQTYTQITAENILGIPLSDSIFTVNRFLPGTPYSLKEIASIRLQRVLPIALNPIQYNPQRKEAQVASRIAITISFNTSRTDITSSVLQDAGSEALYRSTIINAVTGAQWRHTTLSVPARSAFGGKTQSALAGTAWYTIKLSQEGIYKITYQDLVKYGIQPSLIDPRTIKLYNNGGTMLPEGIKEPRPDGLIENAIRVIGEEDGRFDQNDYILFYGRSIEGWKWNIQSEELQHYGNLYARENIYWLTYGGAPGKRMKTTLYTSAGTNSIETGTALVYREDERYKMHQTGSNFYMEILHSGDSKSYQHTLSGYKLGTPVHFSIAIASSALLNYETTVRLNGTPVIISPFYGYTDQILRFESLIPDNGAVILTIENSSSSSMSQVYVDWYEIEYTRMLTASDGMLKFLYSDSPGITQFAVRGFTPNQTDIYNITNFSDVRLVEYTYNLQNQSLVFTDTLHTSGQSYYAVAHNHYLLVPLIQQQSFTDLHTINTSTEMIIITPREFFASAQRLKEFKESNSVIKTEVVCVEDIYNTFSGGLVDPVAIRDFVKFAFEWWIDSSHNPPNYLLLFGDGNYDYRNILKNSAPNWIPPFQINSVYELNSRTMDDFYGYVSGDDTYLDMAVGRLPVQNSAMARNIVDKIITYQSNPEYGSWRNLITFTADDEISSGSTVERLHTDQSESLSQAPFIPAFINKRKIYLMEYPGERPINAAGIRKPSAENDLITQINDGTFLVTYFGHGNERLLAAEYLLNRETDMPRINNGKKQFLFYISTCDFGRWDIPDEDSMGEQLLTASGRGAIAIISSARLVFSGPNFSLAYSFFQNLFNGTRKTTPLGLALMQAKLVNNSENSEKYHLLGDPSMPLKLPDDIVSISSVNPDSLKALATVQVNGSFSTSTPYSGSAYLTAFDTEKTGEHTMDNGEIVTYQLPGSPVFRGNKSVSASTNNRFTMGFIVPIDITYGGTNGKISLYVWNPHGDGAVSVNNLTVGGTFQSISDNTGPEISILFNGRTFVSGDIIPEHPETTVILSDPYGINITGEVGHKIELTLDENSAPIDLSRFFEYDDGSYTTGKVRYRIPSLSSGKHTIAVKAWDNVNNSSVYKAIAIAEAEDRLIVKDVFNYPNPFSKETQFTCQINAPADIEIKIYTVAGRVIKKLQYIHTGGSAFFASPSWDGTDEDGDKIANGTYFYKLIAKSMFGGRSQQAEVISKLVIMR